MSMSRFQREVCAGIPSPSADEREAFYQQNVGMRNPAERVGFLKCGWWLPLSTLSKVCSSAQESRTRSIAFDRSVL
jgi:hypothetical protein